MLYFTQKKLPMSKEDKKSSFPETLFHITNNIEAINGILLEQSFKPSFSMEVVKARCNNTPYYWVPMVSFCDFKISELSIHFEKYGNYGIGLSKKWGIDNGLNPVLYINQSCDIFGEIRQALINIDDAYKILSENPHDPEKSKLYNSISECNQKILNIYCYTKNYQGELKRKGVLDNDFRYADDREWRYIPNISPTIRCCTDFSDTGKENIKNHYNAQIEINHRLNFSFTDIKFIIVPTEEESTKLISFIISSLPTIDMNEKLLLISRIIIVENLDL